MNLPIAHGLACIAAIYLAVEWTGLLMRYNRDPQGRLWQDKRRLVALGLVLDAIGVASISGYRVAQYFLASNPGLADTITNVSLSMLIAGTSLLLWSSQMDGKRWRWRLYLASAAAWILFMLCVSAGVR